MKGWNHNWYTVLRPVAIQVHTPKMYNCCYPGMNLTNSIPSKKTVISQLLMFQSHNSNFLVNLIDVFILVDFKLQLTNTVSKSDYSNVYGPKISE